MSPHDIRNGVTPDFASMDGAKYVTTFYDISILDDMTTASSAV